MTDYLLKNCSLVPVVKPRTEGKTKAETEKNKRKNRLKREKLPKGG